MKLWRMGQCLAVIVLIGLGCGSSDKPAPKVAEPSATQPSPAQPFPKTNAAIVRNDVPPPATQAQGKLQTLKLFLGPEEVIAEIAITEKEVMTGMMHRTSMGENEGMLFVFGVPHQARFWMKNTVLPLSCAYIDPEGVILETHEMKPLDETGIEAATNRVQYVLEMNKGWFDRHNIKPGALVRTERGTLVETFFRR